MKVYSTERGKKSERKSDGKWDLSGRPAQLTINCPQCSSKKTWRDGIRKTGYSDVQRYLCRECVFRFSVDGSAKSFYMESSKGSSYQIGAVPNAHAFFASSRFCRPTAENSDRAKRFGFGVKISG